MRDIIIMRKKIEEVEKKLYDELKDEKYVGIYKFLRKIIIIRENELIKKVMVKDL